MYSHMHHYFIAIEAEIPVVDRLYQLQHDIDRAISQDGTSFRAVNPELMHMTLKFLGEKDPRQFFEMRTFLDRFCSQRAPFSIRVGDIGGFPSLNSPHIIFVKCLEGGEHVRELAEGLDHALRDFGYEYDNRIFVPHLSLGRVRAGRSRLNLHDKLSRYRDLDYGASRIREVILFESALLYKGL